MSEKVDKRWKETGLQNYSLGAIVGTLKHYGATVDEAGFAEFAKDKAPLEIAMSWRAQWNGTGPWATFPYAAANEMLAKVFPERLTPMKGAHTLMQCVVSGMHMLEGKRSDFENELGQFESMVKQIPEGEKPRTSFLGELVGLIESAAQSFNELPEKLAKANKSDAATRVALAQEAMFPDRKGMVMAVVRSHSGERMQAVADLKGWASEEAREVYSRYSALDALYMVEGFAEIKDVGLAVFDAAAAQEEWSLADSIAHLLAHVSKRFLSDRPFSKAVAERLALAHQHTGGHH
jgi:hypothetical protein